MSVLLYTHLSLTVVSV